MRARGEAIEVNKFSKLITIDEIPPTREIKAIILFEPSYANSFNGIEIPNLVTAYKFQVIGNSNEVGKIIC